MFDIGFSELVLIFIVGLVVLGPQRLPVAIRTVVGWIRTIRGMAANVQNELSQELKLNELKESIRKAEQLNLSELSPELARDIEELKASASTIQQDINTQETEIRTTLNHSSDATNSVVATNLTEQKSDCYDEIQTKSDSAVCNDDNDVMTHLHHYQGYDIPAEAEEYDEHKPLSHHTSRDKIVDNKHKE